MPRVKNRYKDPIEEGDIWIMRPGKWGNPFYEGTREENVPLIESI